jgi:hypothetical protein
MKNALLSGSDLLIDARLAHALLDLDEFTNNEERRFRALLKADEVVNTMNRSLASPSLERERRGQVERERDALLLRLERAVDNRSQSARQVSA